MDNRPIGVFDSGVGGLSVVKELRRLLPQESIVYFGDTGRAPYGILSPDVIHRYAGEDLQLLVQQGVKLAVAACGTASSVIDSALIQTLPVPFLGIIEATAAAAVKQSRSGRIGILGTNATIQSGSFVRALHRNNPELAVIGAACPRFVALAEQGCLEPDSAPVLEAAREYLAPVLDFGVDTLILGCTHFPLLAPALRSVAGKHIALIDSGAETAKAVKQMLDTHALHCSGGTGSETYLTSRQDGTFAKTAALFLDRPIKAEFASAGR